MTENIVSGSQDVCQEILHEVVTLQKSVESVASDISGLQNFRKWIEDTLFEHGRHCHEALLRDMRIMLKQAAVSVEVPEAEPCILSDPNPVVPCEFTASSDAARNAEPSIHHPTSTDSHESPQRLSASGSAKRQNIKLQPRRLSKTSLVSKSSQISALSKGKNKESLANPAGRLSWAREASPQSVTSPRSSLKASKDSDPKFSSNTHATSPRQSMAQQSRRESKMSLSGHFNNILDAFRPQQARKMSMLSSSSQHSQKQAAGSRRQSVLSHHSQKQNTQSRRQSMVSQASALSRGRRVSRLHVGLDLLQAMPDFRLPDMEEASEAESSSDSESVLSGGSDAMHNSVVPCVPSIVVDPSSASCESILEAPERDFSAKSGGNFELQTFDPQSSVRPEAGHLNIPRVSELSAESSDEESDDSATKIAQMRMNKRKSLRPQPATRCGWFQHYCRDYVVNTYMFDALAMCMVTLSTIIIGIRTDWQAQILSGESQVEPLIYGILDSIFLVWFAIELILRMLAYGPEFVTGEDRLWNILDFVVVACQFSEELSRLISQGAESTGLAGRLFRVLRLLRIMRIVRLLRFIREIRVMIVSIFSSVRSLGWTLMLLGVVTYSTSVLILQVIIDAGSERTDLFSEDTELTKYFSNLPRTSLSLYQSMVGGVSWDEPLTPLIEVSAFLTAPFIFYVSFAIFAMTNIVTAIFVDSVIASTEKQREKEAKARLYSFFSDVDTDNGQLAWYELSLFLEEHRSADKFLEALHLDANDMEGLFVLLDGDNTGKVSYRDFVDGVLRLRGPARSIDLATLMYCNQRVTKWWKEQMRILHSSLELLHQSIGGTSGRRRNQRKESFAVYSSFAQVKQADARKRLTARRVVTRKSETEEAHNRKRGSVASFFAGGKGDQS
eukprot:TRINITY_DN38902_c0_g1_i1.p1 TRINITY_DN38902_c0_g1~~TRINITY_DN38902_c0_g1_i1.p1  ORF type:complete len:898 (+),score=102.16 TRINITY_DN38902_c0_g1_i1:73-2766(+)